MFDGNVVTATQLSEYQRAVSLDMPELCGGDVTCPSWNSWFSMEAQYVEVFLNTNPLTLCRQFFTGGYNSLSTRIKKVGHGS